LPIVTIGNVDIVKTTNVDNRITSNTHSMLLRHILAPLDYTGITAED